MQSNIPNSLLKERFISLCTFKKNGERKDTPVIFGVHGKEIIVSTKSFASKLKRLKNNSNVILYPCNSRGERKGDDFKGIARILDKENEKYAYNALRKKNGIIFPIWRASGRLRGHKFLFISLKLTEINQGEIN